MLDDFGHALSDVPFQRFEVGLARTGGILLCRRWILVLIAIAVNLRFVFRFRIVILEPVVPEGRATCGRAAGAMRFVILEDAGDLLLACLDDTIDRRFGVVRIQLREIGGRLRVG